MNPYLVTVIMFGTLLVTIVLGIPIAFGTALIGLLSAYFIWGKSSIFIMLTSTTYVMNNWVLVAVPLFVFMAMILNKLGVITDLYEAIHKWSGPVPGGLAIATILVGTVMGACTGIAAGVVVALGIIAVPEMMKHQYDKSIPMGSAMVAGCLAQLIPPSVSLVVYGAMTQTSVGSLFAAGITVGLLYSAIYCSYILIRALLNRSLCPTLPASERASWSEKFASLRLVVLPLFLILSVLGSIFSGIATPTEGSAVGCLGAIIVGVVNRRLSGTVVKEAAVETLKVTALCMWIAIGAKMFGSVFDGIGGHKLITELTTEFTLGTWGVFTVMMVILLIMGCFMDQIAIIFITAPMFAIAAGAMGFDPIWFGIVYMLNMFIGFLTPPFGYALFYMKGVAPPGTTMGEVYKAAVPFIVLMILGMILVIVFPSIATWLPYTILRARGKM
jgi:tripartite ATP-independent transporter DctM subunit